jgi:hypothetical protein
MYILDQLRKIVHSDAVVADMRRDDVRSQSKQRVFRVFISVHLKNLPEQEFARKRNRRVLVQN